MMPTLLQYGPIGNILNFLHFYQNHHTLDEIPKPTIRTMDAEYTTVEERTNAMQYHTASLQRPKNFPPPHMTNKLKKINVYSTLKNSPTRSLWESPPKTPQWNWTEKVPQTLNNFRTSSGKNVTNVIANTHG